MVWTLIRKRSPSFPPSVTQVEVPLEVLTKAVWHDAALPKFDVVYHLGAYTPKNSLGANDLERCFTDNVLGTKLLLDSIDPLPERLVFSSTLDVYSTSSFEQTINEQSPIGPSSYYGSSKYFAEAHVAHWAAQTGVSHSVLRYGHIYGPGESAYEKLIPETIRRLLSGKSPIINGDGSAARDLLYVEDAVEATIRAGLSTRGTDVINIVRGESVSVQDIVEVLTKTTGFAGRVVYRTDLPAGKSYYFDNFHMHEQLGHWPLVPLKVGLQCEVDAMRAN